MQDVATTEHELASSVEAWQQAVTRTQNRTLRVEDFQLGRTIGKGRYARVRLARLEGMEAMPLCLKILKKKEMCRLEQIEHVVAEKDVLASASHPFIIQLLKTFQDSMRLYMALELVNGGELFNLLRSEKNFKLPSTQFYTAEIVSALTYLHEMLVVYRDLKPENILIHKSGHLKLTDFGFAKLLKDGRTYTICGTPAYMAPEILTGKHAHGLPVDWWGVGILTFEFIAGRPPFDAPDEQEIYRLILAGHPAYPPTMDKAARDFVQRLLLAQPSQRLGGGVKGPAAVRGHSFFKSLDWADADAGRLVPPWRPSLGTSQDDASLFDRFEESNDGAIDSCTASSFLGQNEATDKAFAGWSERRGFRPEALDLAAARQKKLLEREEQKRKQKDMEMEQICLEEGAEKPASNGLAKESTPAKPETSSKSQNQSCCSLQ